MTPTERLRAVAERFRALDGQWTALAALFDFIAEQHTEDDSYCVRGQPWPCPDVRAALAVADALGIER